MKNKGSEKKTSVLKIVLCVVCFGFAVLFLLSFVKGVTAYADTSQVVATDKIVVVDCLDVYIVDWGTKPNESSYAYGLENSIGYMHDNSILNAVTTTNYTYSVIYLNDTSNYRHDYEANRVTSISDEQTPASIMYIDLTKEEYQTATGMVLTSSVTPTPIPTSVSVSRENAVVLPSPTPLPLYTDSTTTYSPDVVIIARATLTELCNTGGTVLASCGSVTDVATYITGHPTLSYAYMQSDVINNTLTDKLLLLYKQGYDITAVTSEMITRSDTVHNPTPTPTPSGGYHIGGEDINIGNAWQTAKDGFVGLTEYLGILPAVLSAVFVFVPAPFIAVCGTILVICFAVILWKVLRL